MMLNVLVDTLRYVENNCYQHQLLKTLRSNFDVNVIELDELGQRSPVGNNVLSCLKLRTLDRNIDRVKKTLGDKPVMIYDQDPWENFIVGSTCFGSYSRIVKKLNVTTFINTSRWWSEKVNDTGIHSVFVNMWMLPEYCTTPASWRAREHDVAFIGTMYPRRRIFFNALEATGIHVKTDVPVMDYQTYLKFISSCKIIIRSELIDWTVDFGKGPSVLTDPNALWIRDVECASRGCFSMREDDDEKLAWGLDACGSVVCFSDHLDAAAKIRDILALAPQEAEERLTSGMNFVKDANKWLNTARVIRDLV